MERLTEPLDTLLPRTPPSPIRRPGQRWLQILLAALFILAAFGAFAGWFLSNYEALRANLGPTLLMITAIVGTQSTHGDVDTVGTLADWTATVALVVVGRGLLRSRWWAAVGAWATSVGLTVFGVYWAIWGNSDTGPGAPFADPLTGAELPWPVFVVPGLVIAAMLLPRSSRTWIQQARRKHQASSH